ncbi:MAG: hypothetical protein CSA74_12850 [Rhodobacterales bacterium]|nr:MAG: hypothetical protein CSA74_12850 [Rhodobacterales bacterium]
MTLDDATVLARLAEHGIELDPLNIGPYTAGANALAAQVAIVREVVPAHAEPAMTFRTPLTEEP